MADSATLTDRERTDWLRLMRSRRVGPATFWRLMSEQGSIEAALAALPGIARDAGVEDYRLCPDGVVAAELRAGRAVGARLIASPEPDYPAALRDLDAPPPLIWVRGDIRLASRPAISVVGARNASSLGQRMAARLARDLGEGGFVVVSGLARGIDTVAHKAALEIGTIAVCAGGLDVVYPPQNADLMAEIADRGLLISDQPMGLQPQARHFPARNLLVAALGRATAVIEAAAKSGSLITARAALDQGREVFAVPGHPFDARASGCNHLIRDGAQLLRGAADIFEALGHPAPHPVVPTGTPSPRPRPARAPNPALRDAAALHGRILDRLGPSPLAEDQLIRDLGTDAGTLSPLLTDLELDGRIARQPGGLISRLN